MKPKGKMGLCFKITAGLLLLVQAFRMASLQDSTDSPGRTIDKSWLREPAKNIAGSQNAGVTEGRTEYDLGTNVTAMESTNDYSGIASGSMAIHTEEEENVSGQNDTSEDLSTTMPPNVTTYQPELPDTTVLSINSSTDPMTSDQVNTTGFEEEFYNSTTYENSTSFLDYSNHTNLQEVTSAPPSNATTTKPGNDTELANGTTTTITTPRTNETLTTSSSITVFQSETTDTSPETTSTDAPNIPKKGNETDKSAASGSSSERGLASDSHMKRKGVWGAMLGTSVAVVCVGLVAYIILKKKHQKGFSHKKLVEDYPADPVLRLDNIEPLDLNFGGSAYYNPGLQGDNIQMTNLPERHQN